MNFIVFSKKKAMEFLPTESAVMIAVTDDPTENLTYKGNYKEILKLVFEDVDVPTFEQMEFTDRQATEILDFFFKWDTINLIVIHCNMGMSRSPAIAAALSKIRYGYDDIYFNLYTPNRMVYSKILTQYYSIYAPE